MPAPYAQPRLASVGQVGTVTYDADGYPIRIVAIYRDFTLMWNGGVLASVTAAFTPTDYQHTVTASFTFTDGKLTEMSASCAGACSGGTSRTDTLRYDATGALTDWSSTGMYNASRHYTYDDRDRLLSVTTSDGTDFLTYSNNDGCPTYDSAFGASYHYIAGHLSAFIRHDVIYDDAGRIARFTSTGPAFQDLLYGDGEARGIDLWPGDYNGGFAYGFPAHGELFRLDGTCDPTLRSQPTIIALVVSSLP